MPICRIASQLSAGVKRDFLSPSKVRLALAWGFPYDAFDGQARVKPWHIISMVESGRALSFNQLPYKQDQTFLSVDRLYVDHNLFQGSAKLDISKALYDISLTKTPLTLEKELLFVGKSSLNVKTDVILSPLGIKLASCEVQSVLVDRETRRPVPFPDWWMEMYGQFSSPEKQLKVVAEKEPLDVEAAIKTGAQVSSESEPFDCGVTSVDMVVCASDTDVYGHTNWSAYLKYCIDALASVSHCRKSDYMLKRAVKTAQIAYKNEGSLGQKIHVRYWRKKMTPNCVHFNVVSCADIEQMLSYACVEFYDLTDVSMTNFSKL
ncbi:hypothetical protein BaRGS_00026305 [Batillaria attramentaria]|uniref:Uncharacterized protein n=1 Tax=Batillaria attramentaria TaxID=370345 RepID=A0ABD0K6J2_9CAEN